MLDDSLPMPFFGKHSMSQKSTIPQTQAYFKVAYIAAVYVHHKKLERYVQGHKKARKVSICRFFLRCFKDPSWVPRISKNYHRVPKIRENQVPRIREIGFLQISTRYLTFSLKKTLSMCISTYCKKLCSSHRVDLGIVFTEFVCSLHKNNLAYCTRSFAEIAIRL